MTVRGSFGAYTTVDPRAHLVLLALRTLPIDVRRKLQLLGSLNSGSEDRFRELEKQTDELAAAVLASEAERTGDIAAKRKALAKQFEEALAGADEKGAVAQSLYALVRCSFANLADCSR